MCELHVGDGDGAAWGWVYVCVDGSGMHWCSRTLEDYLKLRSYLTKHCGCTHLTIRCAIEDGCNPSVPEIGNAIRASSILWLLMPWLLVSPGHQHPWPWLCRVNPHNSRVNIDGLVQDCNISSANALQDCSISSANALEILQSCTKPSISCITDKTSDTHYIYIYKTMKP